jgi:hypothetical protein
MKSQGWGFHHLDQRPQLVRLKADVSRRPLFTPQRALVRNIWTPHPPNTLLGLPQEIRCQTWGYVIEDIEHFRTVYWQDKPRTPYDTIPFVCRQLYHEIDDYLWRSIVPSNHLTSFWKQPYSELKLLSLNTLSLEMPFNMGLNDFMDLGTAIRFLKPTLQNLQLFFTGCDAYGTRVFLHGCGNRLANATSRDQKLPQDGQGFDDRYPIFNALDVLVNLRTLVVSNPNLPLMQQQLFRNKPLLEKMCIISDPRSTLHIPWNRKNCGTGHLLPVSENFPPIKELYLGANSVLGCAQVPGKLSPTLEKLTWIVPNLARQAGSMVLDWHDDTGVILMNLRSNSKRLHTLRICIEGSTYEGHAAYGTLIGAFKLHVPYLTRLKNLELHLWSKSPYMAEEFIYALPTSLERFYTSDRFVPTCNLVKHIKDLHFTGSDINTGELHVFDLANDDGGYSWPNVVEELRRTDVLLLGMGRLGFVGHEWDDTLDGRSRMIEATDEPLCAKSTNTRRSLQAYNDYSTTSSRDGSISLLRLNGRLLDKERNSHLTENYVTASGHIIPCIHLGLSRTISWDKHALHGFCLRMVEGSTPNEATRMGYQEAIPDLDVAAMCFATPRVSGVAVNRSFYAHATPTDTGPEFHFNDNTLDAYFGNESEAEKVFEAECTMKPEDVSPRKYPIIVPCPTGYEDHEHWMCN